MLHNCNPEWMLIEGGAAHWVGLPSKEQLAAWLSPQKMVLLAPLASQTDRAVRALRTLDDRLPHSSSLNASPLGGDLS